jgi:GAF domain-containing protein
MNTKYWKIANSKTPEELSENFHETAKVEFQDLPIDVFSVLYKGKMNDKYYLFSYAYERKKSKFNFDIAKYKLSDKKRPAVVCYKHDECRVLMFGDYKNEYSEKIGQYTKTDELPEVVKGTRQKSIIYLRLEVENEKLGLLSLQSRAENIFTDRHVEMLKNIGFYVAFALKQIDHTNEQMQKIPDPLIATIEQIKNQKKSEKEDIIKSLLDVVKNLWDKRSANPAICKNQAYLFAFFSDNEQKQNMQMTAYVDELAKSVDEDDVRKKRGRFIGEKYEDRIFYEIPYPLRRDDDKPSVGGWCYFKEKDMFMNDAGKEDDPYRGDCVLYGIDPKILSGEDTQSILYYPLYDNKEIFGLLSIQNKKRYAYTDYDFKFFKTIAPFVGRAWLNSQNPLMKRVRECFGLYENNKKNPKMLKLLAEEIAKRIFRKTSGEQQNIVLSLCMPNKNVLDGKKYENGEIKNYQVNIDDENSIEAKVYNSKKDLYDESKRIFAIPLMVQGEKNNEIIGVITVCLETVDDFLEEQRNALTFLSGHIALSIDSDRKQLRDFHTRIQAITEIDYENLIDENKEEEETEMVKLYNEVYELLFGETNKNNKDLFSLTLWLKETVTEQYRQDLLTNHYTKPESILRSKEEVDKQKSVLVDYCFEHIKNAQGKIKPVLTKHAAHLHDYNRPGVGCFCLAEQGKSYDNEDYMELNDWHDKNEGCNSYQHYIDVLKKSELTLVDKPFTKSEWKKKVPQNNKDGLVTNSLLFCPIKVNNVIRGVLSFQHAESYYFNESHRTILKILATIIGISIENRESRKNFIEGQVRSITHDIATPIDMIQKTSDSLLKLQIEDLSLNDSYFKDESAAEEVGDKKIFETFKDKIYNRIPKKLESAYSSLSGYLMLLRCMNKNAIQQHKESFALENYIKKSKELIKNKLQRDKEIKTELDNEYWDKIDFDLSECKHTIYSVPIIFERIFYNLMLNSFEHAFVARQDNPQVKIISKLTGNDLCLEYCNNGKAIEEQNGSINWIFEAGETTKKHDMATGLGLYGVKSFVKDILDGKIECRNNFNGKVGVTFIIQIPNAKKREIF